MSERSRWFHIDTPEPPVPAKPTGLSATASHDQVILTWDDPGDDSITGYVILRRVRVNDQGGEFSELVADTGTAATTYTDDTVAASTHLHLPDQGHQRVRSERALPLVPHRHPGGPVAGIEGCAAEEVICTRDGRILSNELILTVSGPADRAVPGCRPVLYGQQKSPDTGTGGRGHRSALCWPLPRQGGQ